MQDAIFLWSPLLENILGTMEKENTKQPNAENEYHFKAWAG